MATTEHFELEIIYPTSSKCINVLWLEVQAPNGSFLIGPGHSPLISKLRARSEIKYKTVSSGEELVDVYGEGLLKVSPDKVVVILGH